MQILGFGLFWNLEAILFRTISRGSYRTSYASAELFPGRRSTFEASTKNSLKYT